MTYQLKRINPNQTQVFFHDGRFETLTNEELDDFLAEMGEEEIVSADLSLEE
ncbi:hypothetical protein [Bacillus marasmi]|uniref:hypothetical protein n=1 Tax=Bacillus marasmi TaxID=1926279 RepID=UPI00164E8C9C|nr:hypothetical protein [Bacillus marasmi]